jgi:predicted DNA-binding antitoxin AbrB/MazE fold protein
MKKTLFALLTIAVLSAPAAFADIIPEGEKYVDSCAYFNNTADFLDEFGIFTQEYSVNDEALPYDRLIANECFSKSYKFDTFEVYGVGIDSLPDVFDNDSIDLRDFESAYKTNIYPMNGSFLEEETSPVDHYEYEYTILGMDYENKVLNIEFAGTHTFYNDGSEPTFFLEDEGYESVQNVFTDVDSNSTYYNALNYLKEEGIVNGYEDGSFKPENKINRAEFTKILIEATTEDSEIAECTAYYANQTNAPAKIFSDVIAYFGGSMVSEWYVNYICVAKEKTFVNGYPDGSFKPSQYITFVEAAKIITKTRGIPMDEGEPWYQIYVEQLDNGNAIPTTILKFSQEITGSINTLGKNFSENGKRN